MPLSLVLMLAIRMIRALLNWMLREPAGCYYITTVQGHRRRIAANPEQAWAIYFAMQRGEL
jgi:hypothetical protein